MSFSLSISLPLEKTSIGEDALVPANVLRDEDGNPILDENGDYILVE